MAPITNFSQHLSCNRWTEIRQVVLPQLDLKIFFCDWAGRNPPGDIENPQTKADGLSFRAALLRTLNERFLGN